MNDKFTFTTVDTKGLAIPDELQRKADEFLAELGRVQMEAGHPIPKLIAMGIAAVGNNIIISVKQENA